MKLFKIVFCLFIITFFLSSCGNNPLIWVLFKATENHEYKPPTEKEIRKNEERKRKRKEKIKKDVDENFPKYQYYSPIKSIVQEDSLNLLNGVKQLLTFSDSSNFNPTRDSIQLRKLNKIFKTIYPNNRNEKFKNYRNSLKNEFMTYSEDYKHFFSILTFEFKNTEDIFYMGITMLCEKKETETICFAKYNMKTTHSSREGYIDYIMTKVFRQMKKEKIQNIWENKAYADYIVTENGRIKKYQSSSTYSYDQKKHIPTLSEYLTIKKLKNRVGKGDSHP